MNNRLEERAEFWRDASTIMVLIRDGIVGFADLRRRMAFSHGRLANYLNRLVSLGLIERTGSSRMTLRLTDVGAKTVSHIKLVCRLEGGAYVPANGNGVK